MTFSKKDLDWIEKEMDKRSETLAAFCSAQINTRIDHLDSSDATKKAIAKLEERIDSKVGFKQFAWIVGLLVTFMTAILGAIWVQVSENGKLAHTTHYEVSYMRGILTNSAVIDEN